ncbi:hypothetical protein [Actinoplanes sp. NPDC026670]|uniref:hypothetical protein n=1 Tax=Actinoplanes sp. NPDC026670 TaxID=3154700 RepID=UPI0033FF45F9
MSWPILTVGPRNLPANGLVRVWIDIGSGPGYMREVRCDQLTLADEDDGEGDSAVYRLCPAVAPAG